ncbi:MAG: cupin domain-containing protein [Actinobacteria bacterium]|nr:cupin domain-containing protein [Actinomycetota bacterium]
MSDQGAENKSAAHIIASATKDTLEQISLSPDQIESGSPETRILELADFAGVSMGIWEHTEGVSTDTEADEVFIVISGGATIEFTDDDTPPLEVTAGDIVRLSAGAKTRWIVRDHIRKVYLVPA